MQDGNAKQQIVERIKGATNILVTVNSSPTVDELSAALGFTLMLNKMDKHATAVFSGELPSAINFLNPDKTFENTVDSLRDFIIALDKEKADRLRYKVEDDVVRIFITPYKTTITDKDLQFSQGDFNIELIVALGVEKRDDLDKAIVAHGRILHDATVVTVNIKDEKNSIGSIDWQDSNASSLCEMLMSLSEAMQPGLLDEQISNALLTGIVAATERFSNQHTTPRVMTMSAQLMAAGANQQLIATKLEEKNIISSNKDGSTDLQEGTSSRVKKENQTLEELESSLQTKAEDKPRADGEMHVEHDAKPEQPEDFRDDSSPNEEPKASTDKEGDADGDGQPYDVERELSERLNAQLPSAQSHGSTDQLGKELDEEHKNESDAASHRMLPELPEPQSDKDSPVLPLASDPPKEPSMIHDAKPSWMGPRIEPPSMGSPLSATTQQALDDADREREESHKYTLLNHGAKESRHDSKQSTETQPAQEPFTPEPTPPVLPDFPMQFEESPIPPHAEEPNEEAHNDASQQKSPTLAELEAQAHAAAASTPEEVHPAISEPVHDVDQAREAVNAALNGTAFDPANSPLQSVGATAFPPIVHESQAEALPNPPELPPLPDFGTLPPLPSEPPQGNSPFMDPNSVAPDQAPSAPVAPPQESNPGQFKIPGQ